MSRAHDKNVEETELPTTEPAGRVEIDSRGHNVWRWARDVIESTSVLLKRLDNKDLSLEPTQKVPIARGADVAAKSTAPKATAPKGTPPKSKKATAKKEAAKNAEFHPALQPDHDRDGGGGFDPYNSR